MTQEEARSLEWGQPVYKVAVYSNAAPKMSEYKVGEVDRRGYYRILHPTGTQYWAWANPLKLASDEWFLDKLKAIDHFRQHSLAYYRAELAKLETRRESLLETIHNLEH